MLSLRLAASIKHERELLRAVASLSTRVVQLWARGPARSGDALARALAVQVELEALREELLKELARRRDDKSAVAWRRRLCCYLSVTLPLLHCRVLAFVEAGVYRAVKVLLLTQSLTRNTPRPSTKEVLDVVLASGGATTSPQSLAFASLGAVQAILDHSPALTAEELHAEILHLRPQSGFGEAQVTLSPRRLPLERQRRQWRRAQAALLVMSAAAAGQPTPKDAAAALTPRELEQWTMRGRRGGSGGGGCTKRLFLLCCSCAVIRGRGSGAPKVQADVTLDFEEDAAR